MRRAEREPTDPRFVYSLALNHGANSRCHDELFFTELSVSRLPRYLNIDGNLRDTPYINIHIYSERNF